MNKNKTFGLLYYLRKDKVNKEGEVPIYLRITIDGKRSNLSTNRTIKPEKWNDEGDKVKGTNEESKSLNVYLENFKNQVYQHHSDLLEKHKSITAESLRNSVLGLGEHKRTILEVFRYHNEQMNQKVGIDFAKATSIRYATTLKHVEEFIKFKYRVADKYLIDLNYQFITDFEHYLKTVRKCNHNSTLKYIRNVRKIINVARLNEWLDKDPFIKFKARLEEVNFTYLTDDELESIKNTEIKNERLNIVRDVFIFSCYTGLAYVDVEKLTANDIVTGIDRGKWIYTFRAKTDVKSNIPLLPEALEIIEKYKDFPENGYTGKLLPVISNQKINQYLKEVAKICGINKNITFHTARRTFATTVCLNNDVPIESVSRMIGHTNIRTTQKSYAKVLDKKVSADMQNLRKRLNGNKKNKKKIQYEK